MGPAEATLGVLGLATALAAARTVHTSPGLRRRALRLAGPERAAVALPAARVVRSQLAAVWSGRPGRRGTRAVEAALPETADLLLASLHAGLNVPLALQRAARHAPAPAGPELQRVNDEIALGTPVREALGAFATRTGSDRVRALASILTGSDRFGARVTDSLEQWADDLWTTRRHEVEAAARKAPVRILFPLVLLILPALLLTTVVPMLLSTLRTLGY
jgi:tight adherence protein C